MFFVRIWHKRDTWEWRMEREAPPFYKLIGLK